MASNSEEKIHALAVSLAEMKAEQRGLREVIAQHNLAFSRLNDQFVQFSDRLARMETELAAIKDLGGSVAKLRDEVSALKTAVEKSDKLADQNRVTWPMLVTWIVSVVSVAAAVINVLRR